MTTELIVNAVIAQVGEEKAKEILEMVLNLADKMSTQDIFILKKFESKGVTLISTNKRDCEISFPSGKAPKMFELEKIVRDIEI